MNLELVRVIQSSLFNSYDYRADVYVRDYHVVLPNYSF